MSHVAPDTAKAFKAAPGGTRSHSGAIALLIAPAMLFLLVLFAVPLLSVVYQSVFDPKFTVLHFVRALTVPLYLQVIWGTMLTSLWVTLICLLLGYPVAVAMAAGKGPVPLILFAVVGIAFWTGFVVRTFAWLVILGRSGPAAALIASFGITPPQMLFNSFSANVGMVHILLPFMIFALYAVVSRIDPRYMLAAANLGASPVQAFRTVYLPLSAAGVVSGSVLVFTMCLGFFVTPQLLGSPRDMMISRLIYQQVDQLLAWGFASALAIILMVAVVALLGLSNRLLRQRDGAS